MTTKPQHTPDPLNHMDAPKSVHVRFYPMENKFLYSVDGKNFIYSTRRDADLAARKLNSEAPHD